jgi:deoxycytidine triphosphate deaminase
MSATNELTKTVPVVPIPSSASIDSLWAEAESAVLQRSVLSDKAILAHLQRGSVVIQPFSLSNLSTSSYDVTLGRHYYRESDYECGQSIFNPYSEAHVTRVWGQPKEAELVGEWMKRTGQTLENISETDRIIWLKPGETILGHTNEFIGGRKRVTTMMKARSSLGRTYIEVCKCAG